MIDVRAGDEAGSTVSAKQLMVCRVKSTQGSGGQRSRTTCCFFLGQRSDHENDNVEVLVLNSTSMTLLVAKEGSSKFRVKKRRLLHEIDVSPGTDPASLLIRRADLRHNGPSLTLEFLSEKEAAEVLKRTNKHTSKLQQALDLLEFPGTEVRSLQPSVFEVAVDDLVVARRGASTHMNDVDANIIVKAAGRSSRVSFHAESPMGLVSGSVPTIALFKTPTSVVLLLPEDRDAGNAGDAKFAVEVKFEAKPRRRVAVWLAAIVVAAISTIAIISTAYDVLIFIAALAFRVAVAAMRLDFDLRISSCTIVERQPPSQTCLAVTPKRSISANNAAFSRCLSVDHAISLRRSLITSLDKPEDELQREMRAEIIDRLHDVSPAIDEDLFRRYVAACKGDVSKALSRLEDTAEWRKANDVDNILNAHLPYFFTLKKHYVHALIGRTRDGLPVIVEGMGGFAKAVAAFREEGIMPDHSDEILKQFIFTMEYIFRIVEPTEYPKGQFLRIYDLRGIKLGDVTDSEAVNLGYEMMQMLENHYCERMARAIVIAPPIFSTIWKMVKGLVDPSTAEKIKVVKPSKLLGALRAEMDDDVIPKCWGGNGIDDWYDGEMETRLFAERRRWNEGG